MRLARILGGVGRTLIWLGSMLLAFVAYQLWGTNFAEARSQNRLEDQFAELLDDAGVTTTVAGAASTTTAPAVTTTTTPSPPPIDDGDAIAHLVIPDIGVDKIVVEGVGREPLKKGPGHYPGTPLPGQPGNAAIAGHRTTYGAPFHRIDELEVGDEILVTTFQGSFRYVVDGTEIVAPRDVSVLDDKEDDRLTLTSCHPKYTARKRIVVTAQLDDDPAPPVPIADPTPEPAIPEITSIDAGENREIAPALVWGTVTLAVWLAFYLLSRAWRRWPAYLLGAPVFVVATAVFFENLTRALPANF